MAGWLERLTAGLARTSNKLVDGIAHAVGARAKLDAATLDAIEETLLAADLGPSVAARLVKHLAGVRFDDDLDPVGVRRSMADEIARILTPVARPFAVDTTLKPHVVLVVGVNGSGKTTTIGKLARRLIDEKRQVVLAACDTFRAAAVSQLKIWGDRTGARVIFGRQGEDPAALAYQSLEAARETRADVLLIDTAGRLQNKSDLMAELAKVVRVLKKLDPAAPHDVLLVLDATIGQNAIQQVDIFKSMVNVTGLVMTKLDGTARGGVLVAIAEKFALPVVAIGVGEGVEDLSAFDASEFARGLLALQSQP
ncbi:MAG TPA: signal recognition particle-docking protein FtsY [Alphaproteobacteria bacterium]|nr:signal recognition particle-docking protein FtsY [Alphaproteobacteria bacterium]